MSIFPRVKPEATVGFTTTVAAMGYHPQLADYYHFDYRLQFPFAAPCAPVLRTEHLTLAAAAGTGDAKEANRSLVLCNTAHDRRQLVSVDLTTGAVRDVTAPAGVPIDARAMAWDSHAGAYLYLDGEHLNRVSTVIYLDISCEVQRHTALWELLPRELWRVVIEYAVTHSTAPPTQLTGLQPFTTQRHWQGPQPYFSRGRALALTRDGRTCYVVDARTISRVDVAVTPAVVTNITNSFTFAPPASATAATDVKSGASGVPSAPSAPNGVGIPRFTDPTAICFDPRSDDTLLWIATPTRVSRINLANLEVEPMDSGRPYYCDVTAMTMTSRGVLLCTGNAALFVFAQTNASFQLIAGRGRSTVAGFKPGFGYSRFDGAGLTAAEFDQLTGLAVDERACCAYVTEAGGGGRVRRVELDPDWCAATKETSIPGRIMYAKS